MSDPLYDRLDRMQVNNGYDSDEPAITDFVEDTPMSEVYQDDGRQILPDSDWEMDMINASDEVEQSGRHGQAATSAPASVERLEDLPFHLLEAMLQIATENVDTDYDTIYRPLFEMGLVDYDDESENDSQFIGVDILTEKGKQWYADYQQRQATKQNETIFAGMTPAEISEYEAKMWDGNVWKASAERQQERVAYPPYSFQWNWLSDDDKWTLLKDESARREVLEAELATTQRDLQAALAVIVKAGADMETLRSELVAAKAENKTLWKFYDFMFNVDATGDVMNKLKSDMFAGAAHELLTGDSQMNQDAVQTWAEYDVLLTELKELKASK